MKILKSQKGFTLVEILVVMGIIAMLSTLAVNGYITYRRSALLDLGADNLVSQLNAMKAKATYGTSTDKKFQDIKKELGAETPANPVKIEDSAGGTSKCFGIVFEKSNDKNVGNFTVKSFEVPFVNTKVWKHVSQSWGYKGCDDLKDNSPKQSLNLDAQMKILSVSYDGNTTYDKLVFRFLPPSGKLEAVGNLEGPDKILEPKIVKIIVSSGDTLDPNYERQIELNLSNAKAVVKPIDTNVKTN
ncbi:MAG: prepilin-type N-terminal cleavage/methylation domain-containing protein [Candidatus Peregrinibacteria bacterium]|nr:prepilin-type N-terminal cleavage/methylation domain-containing protein [Candidatus Peregrinibacteria bacterium]